MTDAQLEALLRGLIAGGNETDKIELKSSFDLNKKRDRIRLVRCIAAIANSDSHDLENTGFIILGAKRGRLVGGFSALEKDSTSADIQSWVTNFIEPDIRFSVYRFRDETVGLWGVISIPPSTETHLIKKDYRDDKFSIRKGEIYVRHGDSVSLADRSDLDRLHDRKFKLTLARFETEIRSLRQEVTEFKASRPDLRLYLLDKNNNHHETLEVQPILWEKAKELRDEERQNEEQLAILEKEVEDLKFKLITTNNVKQLSRESEKLRDEIRRRKQLRHEYYLGDPLHARIIELEFVLYNNGSTTAKGINLYVYFPTSLEVSASRSSFIKSPENPSLQNIMSLIPGIVSSAINVPSQLPSVVPTPDFVYPRSGGPEIAKTEKENTAKYWVEKLIQGHGHFLGPIYFVSPETALDLSIQYGIYAENAPGAVIATLQLNIRPKAKD